MPSTKELRLRIASVKSTQQLTKAMKMVAAAKLKKAQQQIMALRPYAAKLQEIRANVTGTLDVAELNSPFAAQREAKQVLAIVVTSNRGLCGPFNSGLLKFAEQTLREQYAGHLDAGTLHILAVGRKGLEYFQRRRFTILENRNFDVFSGLSFVGCNEVAEQVFALFEAGTYDRVLLIFNEFKSVMAQTRRAETFLPVQTEAETPPQPHAAQAAGQNLNVDYLYEPDRAEILNDLIPRSLKLQFYRAVLESNAAEQGARMVAMDGATNNADALIKELRLSYNKARQAAITKEILEISAGADALAA